MRYENEILRILAESGDKGLSVKKIARHVFNAHNSIFEVLSFNDVHVAVQQYLTRNSKSKYSVAEKVGPRGIYRLNNNCPEYPKLVFNIQPDEEMQEEEDKLTEDQSLSLFDLF